MNDVWSIIGLSSLIASVVTVTLGIVKDVLVERYRFKRQSEAGYLQSQITLYSQINFLLKRGLMGATSPEFFGTMSDNIKQLNEIIRANSSLLKPTILDKWLTFMALVQKRFKEKEPKKKKELRKKGREQVKEIVSIIKNTMNNGLIPKYRKIVGETVPPLE